MAINDKGYKIVPRNVAQRIGKISKIGALELAYSLAGRLAENGGDPAQVYDVMRREWETVAVYRHDRLLPVIDDGDPLSLSTDTEGAE